LPGQNITLIEMIPKLAQVAYGGSYHPEQWREGVWAEDATLMKQAGVNLVTVGLHSWASLQPSPAHYTLDWLERVLTLLGDNGILVNLSTSTGTPPPWFARFQPESRPGADGGACLPEERPSFCPNSAAYRDYGGRLVRQLATRFGQHPALALWHIGADYGCPRQACCCDTCAAQFRIWLQQKYGALEALNEHWGTAAGSGLFHQWEEILPAPFHAPHAHPAQRLDYNRFVSDSYLGCLLHEKSILSEITPQVPVTASFSGEHGLAQAINCFDWANHVDFVSFRFFPDPLDAEPSDIAFAYDVQRGLTRGRPWLLLEQAASQVTWRVHNPVKRPGQMRLWSYQALAHGADGVLFQQWRSPETGPHKLHTGMLPHGGRETRTYREVEELGNELRKLAAIRGSILRAEAALVIDWENLWALELEPRPARISYSEIVRSYYRALYEAEAAVDIVSPEAELTGYKLVIAPALYLVRPGVKERLESFVENGGTLIVTFLSGIVDNNDRILPGGFPAPFRKLLGVHVEEFDAFGHQVRHIKTPLRGARCALWADVIKLESAEAVATFTEDFYAHQPAITRNAVGRGLAYYVGTHPEPSFLRTFIGEICVDSGVRPALRAAAGVEATVRSNEHGEFLFLLNHTAAIQFADIGPRIRRDLLTGEMVKGQCQLGPRDARVLQLA
jgi:beta-galactosidase